MEDITEHTAQDAPLLHVQLAGFEGPLDLLLHLVRSQRMDIQSLRLAEITAPYLAHLEAMRSLNLDVGGEFLSIAAVLVWIKSKSLLPALEEEEDLEEEESQDPREMEALLLYRLQRYQQFKDSANWLAERPQLGRDVFPRSPPPQEAAGAAAEAELELQEVSLYGLMAAMQRVLARREQRTELDIALDARRVEDVLNAVFDRLVALREAVAFFSLLPRSCGRREAIAVFLALLELARLGAVQLLQAEDAELFCAGAALLQRSPERLRQQVLRGFAA